jgi:hypothetical protein
LGVCGLGGGERGRKLSGGCHGSSIYCKWSGTAAFLVARGALPLRGGNPTVAKLVATGELPCSVWGWVMTRA